MSEPDRGETMSDSPKCGKTWWGKDGKEHMCDAYEGHSNLTHICDCGERKWEGKSLPKKWMPRRAAQPVGTAKPESEKEGEQ